MAKFCNDPLNEDALFIRPLKVYNNLIRKKEVEYEPKQKRDGLILIWERLKRVSIDELIFFKIQNRDIQFVVTLSPGEQMVPQNSHATHKQNADSTKHLDNRENANNAMVNRGKLF